MNLKICFLITATVLGFIAVTFTSCRQDPVLAPDTVHVSFDTLVMPVITRSCANPESGSGCHLDGGESIELTSYESIKSIIKAGDPNKSKLYNVITSKGFELTLMPPKPYTQLSVKEINNITIWILQGAQEH